VTAEAAGALVGLGVPLGVGVGESVGLGGSVGVLEGVSLGVGSALGLGEGLGLGMGEATATVGPRVYPSKNGVTKSWTGIACVAAVM